ncbi:hypothetical protein PPL_08198 [Heterostelium album PN500]|uniref:FNIP repeat-containing protein n=1 Tax=Heterostelium pallidum (strain ATCC 26659 / Pp 5 / PN500) TaxID=670386 RepID=D3BIW3_HETP5|nr:hypothetical protein PPL_08198 [Heterostelium album PN500]EFA78737.1 hypothetical protein PPL_08198 [Heterostelium album PN500]|eukprot:XP_020430861.1 hypothetical protein PPL_08198 [Heterostelium album PN500]
MASDKDSNIDLFDDVKQCISEYFSQIKSDKTSVDQTFISKAMNTPLFNDACYIGYLLSFCDHNDVLDVIMHIFLKSIEIEYSFSTIQRFKLLNKSLDIESYFFKSIEDEHNNKNCISNLSIHNKTLLLWYILNDNVSLLEQIIKNDKLIFCILGNDDAQSNEYLTFFSILMSVGWLNPQEKVDEEHQHWLNKRVKVKQSNIIDLFLSSSSNKKILVGSLFKMNSFFIRDVSVDLQRLETPEFGEMMIRQFPLHVGIRNLESLLIFDIYRVRSIEMPSNLFNRLLEYIKSNDVNITKVLLRKLYINHCGDALSKILLYFYQRVKEPAILRVLFKSLILMESLDRELIISVLTPFKQEFLEFFNNRDYSNWWTCQDLSLLLSYRIKFLRFASRFFTDQKHLQIFETGYFNQNSFKFCKFALSLPCTTTTSKILDKKINTMLFKDIGSMKFLLEIESIDNVVVFLELLYAKFLEDFIQLDPFFSIGFKLFEKIHNHDPTLINQLVSVELITQSNSLLVSDAMSSLLELRKSRPNVNISASPSSHSISIDKPDQHSLITTCSYDIDLSKNIILSNLRKIVVGPKTQYISTELNQIFDVLNQEKSQQIKIVKLIYIGLKQKEIYIPMLNQSVLSANSFNIGNLVCRKWFYERDKYLVLHYNSNKLNNFNFNSFGNQLKFQDVIKNKELEIETLKLGYVSNRSTTKPSTFPKYVRHIEFNSFDVVLPIQLPHNLEVFICRSNDQKSFAIETTLIPLPPRLHTVHITSKQLEGFSMMTSITTMKIRWLHNSDRHLASSDLPPSLINLTLTVSNPYIARYGTGLLINRGVLPKSLKHLILGMNISLESQDIITQLTSLESLNIEMSPHFKIKLPQSLRKLKLPQNFNNAIDVQYILPDNLESLEFGCNFNQKLSYGDLPANLKELILNSSYSAEITVGSFPKGLETLDLGEYVNPIAKKAFPASLRTIHHSFTYYASKLGTLPDSITSLILDKHYHLRRHTTNCFIMITNNNNNNKTIIYNLSHLLLAELTNSLASNLDRICFSLVCRKWFYERHKYLTLHYNSNKLNNSNFNFNSFRNQLKFQESTSIVIKERDEIPRQQTLTTAKELEIIGRVANIFLGKSESMIATSMPTTTTTKKIPASIKSVSFIHPVYDDLPLLPDRIDTLILDSFTNKSTTKPTTFPESLRYLELNTLDVALPIQLPQNLEVLICRSNGRKPFAIETTLIPLPPRLHTVNITSKHLQYFSMMTSITTMIIRWPHTTERHLASSDLPPSLTNLTLSVSNPYIAGYGTGLHINSESPDIITQLTSLESLNIEMSPHFKIKLPQSLRKLKLPQNFNNAIDVQYILPDNLESLEFGCNFNQKLSYGDLPANLKELILNSAYSAEISVGSFPKGLETLDLGEYDKPIAKKAFPASLRTIHHSFTYYASKLGTLPDSITSLILDKHYHLRRHTTNCFIVYSLYGQTMKGGFTDISSLENQLILFH